MITAKLRLCAPLLSTETVFDTILNGFAVNDVLNDEINTLDLTIITKPVVKGGDTFYYNTPFTPGTKFYLDIFDDKTQETYTSSWVVRNDIPRKINLQENIWEHSLSLGDPALIFQKRNCENFSMTYKLQDVTLESTIINDGLSKFIEVNRKESNNNSIHKNPNLTPYGNTIWTEGIPVYVNFDLERQRYISFPDISTKLIYNPNFTNGITADNNSSEITQTHARLLYDDGTVSDTVVQTAIVEGYQFAKIDDSRGLTGYQTGRFIHQATGQTPYMEIRPPMFKLQTSETNMGDFDNSSPTFYLDTMVNIKKENLTNGEVEYIQKIAKFPKPNLMECNPACYDRYETLGVNHKIYRDRTMVLPTEEVTWNELGKDPNTFAIDSDDTGHNTQVSRAIRDKDYPNLWQYGNNEPYDAYRYFSLGIKDVMGCSHASRHDDFYYKLMIDNVSMNCSYNMISVSSNTDVDNQGLIDGYVLRFDVEPNVKYTFTYTPIWYDAKGNISNDKLNIVEKLIGYYNSWTGGDFITKNRYVEQVAQNDFSISYSFQIETINNVSKKMYTSSSPLTVKDLFEKLKVVSNSDDLTAGSQADIDMTNTPLVESIYENKNAWEVLLEIGKYCHAKPYLEFKDNDLELNFKYYGNTNEVRDLDNTHELNSVYSSRNIQEYIAEMDTYTQNLFQYGNIITEYLKCDDNDGSNIVITDNAVLNTRYPIMEVVKFEVAELGSNTWKDITNYIFEHNIYNTLPVTSTWGVIKGCAVYYHLNGTQIMGFQYKEPSASNDKLYAMKRILKIFYPDKTDVQLGLTLFSFRLTYRTKDNLRIIHTRPDIRKYIDVTYAKYPQWYAFNNQSSKYLDAKKVGENIYGRLIRTGNDELTQEFHCYGGYNTRIKAGDFTFIDGQPYFASTVISNIFNTHVLQEVKWSKNYNALSSIISINSEPRFYEISEQSNVLREIEDLNLIMIGTDPYEYDHMVEDNKADIEVNKLDGIIFNGEYPNYAFVDFYTKDDSDTPLVKLLLPVNCVASGTTFIASVKMKDNFSAGDIAQSIGMALNNKMRQATWMSPILEIISNLTSGGTNIKDGTYYEKIPVRYCDEYGKIDKVNIEFVKITDMGNADVVYDNVTYKRINLLPLYVNDTGITYTTCFTYTRDNIMKDNRETLKFNIPLSLVTVSDRFVISSSVYDKKIDFNGQQFTNYKVALLGQEVSKYSKDFLKQHKLLALSNETVNTLEINPATLTYDTQFDWKDVKAVAIVYGGNFVYVGNERYINTNFILARNVGGANNKQSYWSVNYGIPEYYYYDPFVNPINYSEDNE